MSPYTYCICLYASDLSDILEKIKGTVEMKIERMGNMYNYGALHFGVTQKERITPTMKTKSRRQLEIEHLGKKKKQWNL